MREIKFRAWDKDSKLMLYKEFYDHNWYTTPKNDEDGCHTYSSMQYSDQYHKELMQYTGLKDKNGKEIYEGDIVGHPLCVKGDHAPDEPCEHFVGRIQFETDRGQYFAVNMQRNGYVIEMSEAYKFEVIGNIYENPELIKV